MKTAVLLASQDPTQLALGAFRQLAERERVSESSWNILQIKKLQANSFFFFEFVYSPK
ncbi:hypothetical protein ACIP97_08795 [Peribacillus frigoritolerans]|uniref:hypothetical protein n=1 Tax=Peribacillus frigoritolerans TaxID=450367 RepID=UPI003806A4F5